MKKSLEQINKKIDNLRDRLRAALEEKASELYCILNRIQGVRNMAARRELMFGKKGKP